MLWQIESTVTERILLHNEMYEQIYKCKSIQAAQKENSSAADIYALSAQSVRYCHRCMYSCRVPKIFLQSLIVNGIILVYVLRVRVRGKRAATLKHAGDV